MYHGPFEMLRKTPDPYFSVDPGPGVGLQKKILQIFFFFIFLLNNK